MQSKASEIVPHQTHGIPIKMSGVVLVGHGGFEKLEFRTDLSVPQPAKGEVLIRVAAAAVNNTDINTRIGWYSKTVKEGTSEGGSFGFVLLTMMTPAGPVRRSLSPAYKARTAAATSLPSARE